MISVYKSQAWMLNIVYIRASIVIFHYYMLQNKQYNSRWPDILPNGHFDERTLRRKDILPKGQLAENREIFWVHLERFAYTVNVVCLITVNFRVAAKFILFHKQVCNLNFEKRPFPHVDIPLSIVSVDVR